jgi:short subunit dehydrogenase-like uncharacterized protein
VPRFLVYGATGYTGALIAEECARRKLPAVLGGRSDGVRALAERLGLPFVISGIDEVDRHFDAHDVACVLHCAGPFTRTSKQMVDACLRSKRHYLDITGEMQVFEACAARDAEAKAHGVMVLPGVGFDVVPSDCMAAHVKRRMPDATQLRLCIASLGGALSHGTATTMVEHMEGGGAVRENGKIVDEPAGKRKRTFDLGGGKKGEAISMPWGDVSTAYHSTGIPNIVVYFSLPPGLRRAAALMGVGGVFMRVGPLKKLVQRFIPAGGPDAAARAKARTVVVAEAEDASGRVVTSRLSGPEGYDTTVHAAILCAMRVLDGKAKPGFMTPSLAFGPDLILEVPGTERVDA